MSNDTILAPVAALTLPDSAALTGRAQQALAFIDSFEITDADSYSLAAEELQAIKRRAKEIEAQRTGITGPINTALKAINDLFRGPADLLARAEEALKRKMLGWQEEQERLATQERRKAEEAAAAERKRLEEEAAARQREAQAQAEAAARAAAEAQAQERAAAVAAAAGDSEGAARAAAAMHAQQQRADLARDAAQRAQAEAQTTVAIAQAVTAAPSAVVAPKAKGIATTTRVDFEVQSLVLLVHHVAAHPELINLLAADTAKLRAYVRGLGMACNLPGVRVFEDRGISARAA